jgi:hypothetical protein
MLHDLEPFAFAFAFAIFHASADGLTQETASHKTGPYYNGQLDKRVRLFRVNTLLNQQRERKTMEGVSDV